MPEFSKPPNEARVSARTQVTGHGLYRNVALNGVKVINRQGGPEISGIAVNTGTLTATIIRIIASLTDESGLPIWVQENFVPINIYPGQSADFEMKLPARSTIKVIAEIDEHSLIVNGRNQEKTALKSLATPINLKGVKGYSTLHLNVSVMTHDPVF